MHSLFDLTGKVVVISGGTGVLGAELSRGLAQAGAKVAVLGRDPKKRDQVVNDILINGAGGNRPSATTSPSRSFFDLPEEDLDWVMRLNFMGTLLPSQVFGEVLAQKKEGVILNISSNISSMASLQPLTNVVGYGAAKAAINNLTQWLAVHFNKNYSANIRVNALAPGFFLTEQNRYLLTDEQTGELTPRGKTILEHTPMGRFGEPADLVGTALWLVSDASRFVTGIVVPVDGGFSSFSGV